MEMSPLMHMLPVMLWVAAKDVVIANTYVAGNNVASNNIFNFFLISNFGYN